MDATKTWHLKSFHSIKCVANDKLKTETLIQLSHSYLQKVENATHQISNQTLCYRGTTEVHVWISFYVYRLCRVNCGKFPWDEYGKLVTFIQVILDSNWYSFWILFLFLLWPQQIEHRKARKFLDDLRLSNWFLFDSSGKRYEGRQL